MLICPRSRVRREAVPDSDPSDEIMRLAHYAGLDLPSAYAQELAAAYARVRQMIDCMPSGRSRGDEPAHVFVPAKFRPTEG
jgi:hypothetical protein